MEVSSWCGCAARAVAGYDTPGGAVSKNGIYVRMDSRELARRAITSALVAMELGEHAQAVVLCALALLHLARVVPEEVVTSLIREKVRNR